MCVRPPELDVRQRELALRTRRVGLQVQLRFDAPALTLTLALRDQSRRLERDTLEGRQRAGQRQAAGIAGNVLVTYFPTAPSVGFSLMPIIIIATTIGGLGSIGGTFLGGICCGIIQQVTAMMWNSALQDVPLYVLLLAFIALRPTGFFGVRSE